MGQAKGLFAGHRTLPKSRHCRYQAEEDEAAGGYAEGYPEVAGGVNQAARFLHQQEGDGVADQVARGHDRGEVGRGPGMQVGDVVELQENYAPIRRRNCWSGKSR